MDNPFFIIVDSEEEEDKNQCAHPFRDHIGACLTCGQWNSMVAVHESSSAKKMTTKSIARDIKDYPISDDVKSLADSIYIGIREAGARKISKKPMICFSIYQAMRQTNTPCDIRRIANMVGVDKKVASRAISYYSSPSNTSYEGLPMYRPVDEIITDYGTQCRLTQAGIEAVKADYANLVAKVPAMKQKSHMTVIAALIYSHNKTSGVVIDNYEFAERFSLEPSTVINASNKILAIQNGNVSCLSGF